MLRALEHHVLEEVGEAGPARLLVFRAHVIPDVHRDDRRRMVFVQDHLQAVGERVLLERNGRDYAGRPPPRWPQPLRRQP